MYRKTIITEYHLPRVKPYDIFTEFSLYQRNAYMQTFTSIDNPSGFLYNDA